MQCFLATSEAEQQACLELRYRAYFANGLIPEHPGRLYRDSFDGLGSTLLLGLRHDRRLVATIRMCLSLDTGDGESLPSFAHYSEVQALRRQDSGRIAELSRMATDPGIVNLSYRTTVYATVVKSCMDLSAKLQVERLLLGARREHLRFYRAIMGFTAFSEARRYPPGNVAITMSSLDLAQGSARRGRHAVLESPDRISARWVDDPGIDRVVRTLS